MGEEQLKNKNKISRNKQLILVQTGFVIIVLFSFLVIAVGNMITMSSFSTALSGNLSMFEIYMNNLGDDFKEYKAITSLMDYWYENGNDLVTEDSTLVDNDDAGTVLAKLSKKELYEVTDEEFETLSPEDKKTLALACYKEIQTLLEESQDENKSISVILIMKAKEDTEPVAIFSNVPDGEIHLGQLTDVKVIKTIIANTKNAAKRQTGIGLDCSSRSPRII